MSFKKSFFKNISTFASYSYISQGIEFFSTIILSRLLLPEDYGFVAIIMVFAGFMQLFASVGINASIVRSDYGSTFHNHLHSLSIWIGNALALIMILLAYPIALFFDNMALIVPTLLVSLRFVFESFSYVPGAVLAKKLDFKSTGEGHLLGTVFQITVTIILAYLGFSYWALIIPMMFSPLLVYFYLIRHVNIPFRIYSLKAALRVFKKIRSLMGYMSLSNLFTYWSGNIDKLTIGKFYSEFDLGLYNRAFRFILIATRLITSIFSKVLLPSLKKLVAEKGDANKEYVDIIRIITLFNMPIVALLLLLPKTLVLVLWGEDWEGVAQYLPYVGIMLIYQSMYRTSSPVFLLYGKEKMLTIIQIINSVLKIVIVLIGSFFSILHIITFLTLYELIVSLPMQAYYGFYKSFRYTIKDTIAFWVPNFIIGMLLYLSIYLDNWYLRLITLIAFNLIILYDMRNTIGETFKFLKLKVKRKEPNEVELHDDAL